MTSFAVPQPVRRRLRILRRASEPALPATPRPQRRDCQGQLIAALLTCAGEQGVLVDASFRPWCSATFLGAQHRLTLRIDGEGALARASMLADQLPEADLPIRGHIVADLAVDALREGMDGSALLDLAILTIEDW